MPTKMVSHEEQGSAKVLMFDWSGPTTYRYNSRYPDVATYIYQGLMHWFPEYNANTQAQLPTRL